MTVSFVLAPILNPFHSSRSTETVVCPVCERTFHPWKQSVGRYCTNRCAGVARRLEAIQRRREQREEARSPARTAEERDRAASVSADCMAAYEAMREALS
ncbi:MULTISPECIES: hypothetical protein [unclassified Microbacterium]|uniref:hypothetical protein n=1 Tax=unclassified Microbacterium TaxID=2609290 RepID=UPI00301A841C